MTHMNQQLPSLAFIPEKWKLMLAQNPVHIYINFTYKSQELESIRMSINWCMAKQTVVHPYEGILLSTKREGTADTHSNLGESLEIMLSEKSQSQKAVYCMIQFILLSWNDKIVKMEKR